MSNEETNFMEELLDQHDYEEPQVGDIRKGIIVAITPQGIIVDLGLKRDGLVPSSDLSKLETEERQAILLTLNGMEARLKELEAEAQTFRTRLAEQNFRSLQDSLTEIPNRAAFDERLALEIKRWQRYKKPLCIALADVDNFKSINDNYGHSAGDKTLKVIAKALQQGLRETDFIARYGGEEFVLLFPETALDELDAPLNKLREKIKSIVFTFKSQKVPITISFGASQLTAEDTSRQVFDRADEALYEAKKAGRDRVILKT